MSRYLSSPPNLLGLISQNLNCRLYHPRPNPLKSTDPHFLSANRNSESFQMTPNHSPLPPRLRAATEPPPTVLEQSALYLGLLYL